MSVILRRLGRTAAIAALAAFVVVPSVAQAATPRNSTDFGLFGASDPTYDGVVRQSYAILGLSAVRATVPPQSIAWLLDQQCDDGSFMAYRAGECTPADLTAYTGPDTNSTAAAALALLSVGRNAQARAAVRWLEGINNSDGAWPWMEGLGSDPVSTGMVLQALRAVRPASPDIDRGTSWVRRHVAGCDAGAGVGGMPFTKGGPADSLSSVEVLLGVSAPTAGAVRSLPAGVPGLTCRVSTPARPLLARFVARQLVAGNGTLAGLGGTTGWNETALGALGLARAGVGRTAITMAVARLARHVDDYAGTGSDTKPAALGTLLLVAAVTGGDGRAFGPQDVDLVSRLLDSRRR